MTEIRQLTDPCRLSIAVLIGNSDDKLSQREWKFFVSSISLRVRRYFSVVYFEGFTNPDSERQSACFVGEINEDALGQLKRVLKLDAGLFRQDSIAVVVGESELLHPMWPKQTEESTDTDLTNKSSDRDESENSGA